MRVAKSKTFTERDAYAANVRWYLLKEYTKEGGVFTRNKGGPVEASKRDSAYVYFTKHHFLKHADRKPADSFDTVYLGQ